LKLCLIQASLLIYRVDPKVNQLKCRSIELEIVRLTYHNQFSYQLSGETIRDGNKGWKL